MNLDEKWKRREVMGIFKPGVVNMIYSLRDEQVCSGGAHLKMRDSVKYRFGDRRRCRVAVVLKTMHNVSNIHRFTYQTLPLGIFSIVFSI